MTEIAICDDELLVAERLKKIIMSVLDREGDGERPNCSIRIYQKGEELLRHIGEIQIVFLDIDMPDMDGIDVGRQICELNPDCRIIMETGVVERFKEAFRIHALRFVTKPFDEEEIAEALRSAMASSLGTETMEVFINRNSFQLRTRYIHYIKAYNGYVEIVTQEKDFRKNVALRELEECLDPRLFIQINRKYMVNFLYIIDYHQGILTLPEGKFEVSRRRRKEFERRYVEFDLKYRRMM